MIKYLAFSFLALFISCKTAPDLTVFKQKSLNILDRIGSEQICQQDKYTINSRLNMDSLPKIIFVQGKSRAESCTIYQRMTVEDQDSIFKLGSIRNFYIEHYDEGKYQIGITYEPLKKQYLIGSEIFDRTVHIKISNKENGTLPLQILMLLPIGSFE